MSAFRFFGLCIAPADFYADELRRPPTRAVVPLICVFSVCLLSFANTTVVQHELLGLIRGSLESNAHLSAVEREAAVENLNSAAPALTVSVAFSSLMYLPEWILLTVILAQCAVLLNRDYKFGELLRITGYAFFAYCPILLFSATILLTNDIRPQVDPFAAVRGVGDLQLAMVEFSRNLQNVFPINAVRNLTWFAQLWFYGVVVFGFQKLYRTRYWQAFASIVIAGGILSGSGFILQGLIRR